MGEYILRGVNVKILQLRKARGWTQGQLAELCDTTQQQIAKIEAGVVDPKLTTMRRLADAFGCEVPGLFWTRDEFVSVINETIQAFQINLSRNELMDLNTICAKERSVPPFHPFWEELQINKTKNIVVFA